MGLAGAALLFTPDAGGHAIAHNLVYGFLLLQLGMAGWSFGSIFQKRKAGKAHPVVAGGVQQLAAGLALLPFVPGGGGEPFRLSQVFNAMWW